MIEFVNKYIIGAALPLTLIGVGIYFGFYLRWFHLRRPIRLLGVMRDSMRDGGRSPLRAMTLALAGTLGVGNIVGVSAAIVMGGAGAVFWMCFSAAIAMVLKYGEIVLAMLHRRVDREGVCRGSAMYYISDILKRRGYGRAGAFLGCLFAFLCIINSVSMGCMLQTEAVAGSVEGSFGVPRLWVGVSLALATFIIIRKGRGRIERVTGILVPLMTAGYVVLSLAVIIKRWDGVGDVLALIMREAFSGAAVGGGVLGALLSSGIRYGVMRGLISNEAGSGTSPMAHAGSHARSAAAQGAFGILEVFVDTILLCTLTAVVVLLDGGYMSARGNFIMVTVNSYASVLGEWSGSFMSIAVLLFGFATVICQADYGRECVEYLFPRRRRVPVAVFTVVYSLCNILGAVTASELSWQIADLAIGSMTLINLFVLCLGRREIRRESEVFLVRS